MNDDDKELRYYDDDDDGDDDEYYDEDDDEYEDDDEEDDSLDNRLSGLGSNPKPFGSGLPGSGSTRPGTGTPQSRPGGTGGTSGTGGWSGTRPTTPSSSPYGSSAPRSPSSPFGGGSSGSSSGGNKDSLSDRLGKATSGGGNTPGAGDFRTGRKEDDKPRPSSPFSSGGSTPFGGGSKPNTGPSTPGSSGSSSSSTFGGGSKPGSTPFGGGSKPGTGPLTPGSSGSTPFGGSKPGSTPFGGGSKPGTGPLTPGSSGSSSSSSFGGSKPGTGPLSPGSSGSSSSSTFGGGSKPGSTPFGGGSKPGTAPLSGGGKDTSSGGSSGTNAGGFKFNVSPFGGGDKKDDKPGGAPAKPGDKKDDKPAASGGGLGRFSPFGGKKDDKPTDTRSSTSGKPGDKPAAAASGGLGGITSRLPFGKKDDKPADTKSPTSSKPGDKKDDKSAASGGGLGRFSPFGGKKDDKPADNKPAPGGAAKPGSSSAPAAPAGGLGRFSPFGGKKDDKPADNKPAPGGAAKPGSPASSAPASSGFKMPFGGAKQDDKPAAASSGNKPGSSSSSTTSTNKPSPFGQASTAASAADKGGSKAAAATASTGAMGRFGRLFGRGDPAPTTARSQTKAASKAPQLKSVAPEEGGLTLDNWLDITGVALTLGSLLLFFSAMSAEQSAISAVHKTIGQLFGWGAFAVPLIMFLIGMWLIVRHFGDQAPVVDPIRVVGFVLAFVTVLLIMQYIDTFKYNDQIDYRLQTTNPEMFNNLLEQRLKFSWDNNQAGGGWVGATLYMFLYQSVSEIGGIFVVAFMGIISGMLITRLTVSELAIIGMGVWRTWRGYMKKRATATRVKKQLSEEARAAKLAAMQPAAPAVAMAAPAVAQTLAPEPAAPDAGHGIRIKIGGEVLDPATLPTAATQPPPPSFPAQTPAPAADASGNVFSRFRRQGAEAPAPAAPNGTNGGRSGGLLGGMFARNTAEKPAVLPTLPATPLPLDDEPYPSVAASVTSGQPDVVPSLGDLMTPKRPSTEMPSVAPVAQPAPASQPKIGEALFTAASAAALGTNTPQSQSDARSLFDDEEDEDAAPVSAPAAADPLQARQSRLDEIRNRSFGAAPAPASPAPTPAVASPMPGITRPEGMQQPAASVVPQANPMARPEDAFVPPASPSAMPRASELPSAQAQPPVKPYQERLSILPTAPTTPPPPAHPMSSAVTNQTRAAKSWRIPDYRTLLSSGSDQEVDRAHLLKQAKMIEETLQSFGAPGRVVEINTGPVITQFGVEPDYLSARGGKKQRVKVSAIAALDKDLQLALGARSIRVEAPVPGKGYVGVEVPNAEPALVSLRDVMDTPSFAKHKSPLGIALGQSVSGAPISADLASMPHLLIAGTTGSGKSVCVNAIITSIVARNSPEVVRFVMVDPKRVELTGYNGLPHLVAPVVVELERIVGVLKWVTREMDDRYRRFSEAGARNLEDYNRHRDPAVVDQMPYIIVIIDELADLMMLAPEETERTITRIAALARATGIHLVIATQRPSVDVVTGLIKANFPARIAFAVAGGVDSRVILDQPGAERLLGRGDMLYMSGDSPAPLRLQGVYVSDMEIQNIVRYWKMQALEQPEPQKTLNMFAPSAAPSEPALEVKPRGERVRQQSFWDGVPSAPTASVASNGSNGFDDDEDDAYAGDTGDTSNDDLGDDELYERAVELVRRLDKASVSLLQRRLRIGYTRAARMIDVMEARGVIGPAKEGSSKPRDVLQPR